MEKLAPYWKAVAGFVAPGVALFVADVSDGTLPTQHEWLVIGSTCVLTAFGVYKVKNKAKA